MKRLLIVGAGGFIGGFIAREGLNRGYEVWATVRSTTSLKYLDDPRIHILTLDYDDPDQMSQVLDSEMPGATGWDYVIYNLGATKALDFPEFNRVNFQYLRSFGEVLKSVGCEPRIFLFMSSLSVLGPGDEVSYSPLDTKMLPQPNTRYGVSKLKAEQWLEFQSGLPWVIFRPTGVYGPHDKDYMMMIQAIDSHVDFGVGYRKQLLTFIYVEDLVNAMYDCLAAAPEKVVKKKYIISEKRAYTQKEFRDIVAAELNKKVVLPVVLPLWATYGASYVAEKIGRLRLKPSTLNRDKYNIMKQRNWNADTTDAERDFGFEPRHSLRDGMAKTVAAYLAEKEKK